jgi:diguanylate cyclase (GGDEF)-like protein
MASARVAAERLRRRMAELALPHGESPVGAVTLSIGLAQYDAATMDQFDQLLHQADQALYRAKSQGRDRIAA